MGTEEEKPRVLVVTREILLEGYCVLIGGVASNCRFEVIRENEDGTFLVKDPRNER